MRVCGMKPAYQVGERLDFEVMLNPVAMETCSAIEISVIWFTEGKGSEDMNVHFFRRLAGPQLSRTAEPIKLEFQSVLPTGPISYRGRLVSIRWTTRVRIYLANGEESSVDRSFVLKTVSAENL